MRILRRRRGAINFQTRAKNRPLEEMQQRKDEILAKKAKLAELKRQRELRAQEISASRQRGGTPPEVGSPTDSLPAVANQALKTSLGTPSRTENRKELDSLISSLVGEDRGGTPSPFHDRSRPSSYASPIRAGSEAPDDKEDSTRLPQPPPVASSGTQNLSFASFKTI